MLRLISWLTRGRLAPAPLSLLSQCEARKPARWDRVSPARQRGPRTLFAACRLAAVVALAAAGLQAATGTATVNVIGGVLTLTEVGATSGSLAISSDGTSFIFSDSGAYMIVIDAGGMAAGCSLPGVNIICPMSSVTAGFNVVAGSGDTEAVTVSAPINVSGSISIASGGSLSLSGNLSGSSVILTAAGPISQTAASIITGSLQASGFSVSLTGSNHVSTLGGSASNGVFGFVNSGTLSVNAISATAGVEIVATSGNIDLASTVTVEGENVVVLWAAGAIMNTGGSSENVTAAILQLTASTGIGTSTAPLVTAVGELSASNSTSGGIFIANTGALTVDSVVDNGSGMAQIVFTNAGTLTTSTSGGMAFSTNGNVSVTTTGANSDLVAGAAGAGAWTVFNSTAGTITATAGRDLLFGDGKPVEFQALGAVNLHAGRDIALNNYSYTVCESVTATAGGNVSVLGGAQFDTFGGAIDLTTGAGGTFTANAGGSNGDLQSSGYDVRVTADIINLEDTTSINAGAAAVTLQPVTASQAITLVGASSTTAGNWYGTGNVTGGSLLIGNAADTGGITVGGEVNPTVSTLTLATAGPFSSSNGGTLQPRGTGNPSIVFVDGSASPHTWSVAADAVQQDGNQAIFIAGLPTGGVTVNGGSGAQTFNVIPMPTTPITVNGGASLSNSLHLTSTSGASLLVNSTNPWAGLSGTFTFSGGNPAPVSFSHIEYGPITPPTIVTSFSPATIQEGAGVTVQISISQSNAVPITGLSALSQVSFTDTLPTGLTGASIKSNGCGSGVGVSGQTLTLSGGTLTLGSSCAIAVQATASAPGSFINQTGAVSALESGPGAASNQATLTVQPTVTISAPSVPYGDSALVTVSLDSTATGTITLAVGSAMPAPQTLTNGSTTFTLTGLAVGTHDLTASYTNGNYPNSSATSSLSVIQASTSVALGVSGQSVTATVSVILPGAGAPTGSVQFMRGTTVLGTVALTGLTATLNNATAGSVTATYLGDTDFGSSKSPAVTVYVPTSSILVSSPGSPSALGQSVTFKATLTTAGGPPSTSPGATVQFYDGAAPLGSPVSLAGVSSSGGQATYATSALVAGTHSVMAKYNGDSTYPAAQSGVYSQVVQPSLTISAPAVTYGAATKVTVTVVTNSTAATGALTLAVDSGTGAAMALSGGAATFTLGVLAAGTHTLSVSYSGDANYQAITATQAAGLLANRVLIVNKAATSTAIVVSGQSVTATVSVTPPGAGTPTGSVQFLRGNTVLGSVSLTGSMATLSAVTTGPVAAVYSGDTDFLTSTSATAYVATDSLSLAGSPNPSALGQSITFTATLTPAGGPPNALPTGTVQFLDGAKLLGSATLTSNQATYSTAALAAGAHNISAQYSGDGTYPAAQASYSQVVAALPNLSVTVSPTAPAYGQAVTFTAAVTSTAAAAAFPAPTGQVTFLLSTGQFTPLKPLGTASLTSGTATFAATGLVAGANFVTVQYDGDSTWSGVYRTVEVIVAPPGRTATPVEGTNTAVSLTVVSGQLVLSATVTAVTAGAGVPTGSVQFVNKIDNSVIATPSLLNGTAVVFGASKAAALPIVAAYSGDSTFVPSTSAPLPSMTNAAVLLTASFAPDEIASLYDVTGLSGDTVGTEPLTTSLGGATVTITDSAGVARAAQLCGVFASDGQINLVIPPGTAAGFATVTITTRGGAAQATAIIVGDAAPGIFTANMNGQGVYAGQVVYGNPDGSQTVVSPAVWDVATSQYVANPISLGEAGEQVYLVLFGSGLRHASKLTASANEVALPVAYFGAQAQFPGLDQVNLEVPASLAGAGLVNLTITVDGAAANMVTFDIE
jgi:hypothetical protein